MTAPAEAHFGITAVSVLLAGAKLKHAVVRGCHPVCMLETVIKCQPHIFSVRMGRKRMAGDHAPFRVYTRCGARWPWPAQLEHFREKGKPDGHGATEAPRRHTCATARVLRQPSQLFNRARFLTVTSLQQQARLHPARPLECLTWYRDFQFGDCQRCLHNTWSRWLRLSSDGLAASSESTPACDCVHATGKTSRPRWLRVRTYRAVLGCSPVP